MKKSILLALFVGCVIGAQAQPIKKMKMDQLLKMIDTSKTPLVVNFWATWCGPCIREIPWFEKAVKEYAGQKVKLILVSIDYPDDYAGIAAFAKKQGYTSQIIWLNETDPDVFCPKVDKSWKNTIPVTLMVNNKRKYRQFYNQQLPEPKLAEELRKLVE
ncbi:redoxin domain-containing protein [Sediminibacterium roseum]|uniref:Redoxin domain-containing protein n=1 Tax=Sediminibacterium roseum TaxID=1978412 RepID=A0ABW9ZXN3_9BACT|nr:redoxin domain-containing protein [Sediminibacterium roseum]NCI49928.1 redoxin domain-containing protein [Sediminibacterium roseum]